MNIKKETRRSIVNEFNYITEKMNKANELGMKLYYFSATYGIMGRIKRVEYDPQILCMEAILQGVYNQLNELSNRYAQGIRIPPPPDQKYFEYFISLVERLSKIIEDEKDEEIYKILENMLCFTYSLSGPGYYDREKGINLMPDID